MPSSARWFAQAGDVMTTIDGAGQLFFQGPVSGCVGNGALTPHGELQVFDVSLSIENCAGAYAYLNGQFAGLATETQTGYWDYDYSLMMFLSTVDGSASTAAVTMYASPQ
jgi:hypothetical protein